MPCDIDESIDRLRAFNSLLETMHPELQALASELDGVSHSLTDDEANLREGLQALQSEVDTLGKEATESATDAAHAADELSAHLHQEIDTNLATLEQQVTQTREQLTHMLEESAAALDSELASLQHDGFEPMETLLTQRQSDFAAWADQTDEAAAPFVQELQAGTTEVAAAAQQTAGELSAVAAAIERDRDDLKATKWEMQKVDEKMPEEVQQALTALQGEIHTFHEHLADIWTQSIHGIVERMESVGAAAAKALEDAAGQALAAVDTVTAAIESLDTELERDVVDAESDEARAAAVAALVPQIATAEQEVQEIREVLEAMAHL